MAALTALAGGCASQPDLAPRPARLVPSGGVAGADATVIISGAGFLPRVSQAASGGPATVETTHTAALDGLPLTDVRWLDSGRVQATIPASLGLGLGPHTLTVVNALGHAGTLAAAWTVIEPAGLQLSAAAPARVVVNQSFTVTVTATNPGGAALRGVSVQATPGGTGAVADQPGPPAFDLPPGAERQLQLGFTASAPGDVSLALAASGIEDFTGRQVAASSTPALLVQAPAALVLDLAASPVRVIEGRPVALTVTATNAGGTALRGVNVAVTASGSGAVAGDLTSSAFDLEPGATQQRQLALSAAVAGPVTLGAAASGREDQTDRMVVAAPASAALSVQAPAALVLTASAPPQAIAGLPCTLSVSATNTGGSALRAVAVTVSPSGAGAVDGDLAPPAFDLPPGATQGLQLALTASTAGAVSLGVAAGGLEELGDRAVSAVAATTALQVQAPAALALSATLAPAQASVGQPVTLTVSATNTGGTTLRAVAVAVAPSGAGAVTGDLGTPAFDLPPGATEQRQLALTASAAGPVALGVTASGTEALSDRLVGAATPDQPLLVQARAALVAALSLPATLAAGAPFQVTMTVENRGQAAALAVAPDALASGPRTTGAVSLVSGPSPASATVAGGGQATFTWTWRLDGAGLVELRGGAAGLDGNDGGPVVADPTTSNLGGPAAEVTSVATDPLGDGTPVAALAVRGGALWVGPSQDGSRFYRLDPATGSAAPLGVEIAVDAGDTKADNPAWLASPPATTFGAAGCATDTTACGPSNEDARGLLAAGAFQGDEWLLYGGAAASHKVRYLYLTRRDGPPVPFSAMDLDGQLANAPVAVTAAAFAPSASGTSDRIYVAFALKTAKQSPALVALSALPSGPVLDAATPGDAQELAVTTAPGVGGDAGLFSNPDPQPRIDAMAWFRDRLYLATGSAILAAAVAVPRPYASAATDWLISTPLSPSWTFRRGLPASASAGLTPADRAVPAMAAFGACGSGPCLFLARNLLGFSPSVVPQLWKCDPTLVGGSSGCDRGDWSLAAANASGDPGLTQLGVATNGAVGVLLATGRFLYLGFDNAATGVQLYRTDVVPAAIGDFRGRDGCVAGTAGCQGLGGNGLGLGTAVTRLFDAKAVTTGGVTTLYVAAGDGVGPLRLFAIPE